MKIRTLITGAAAWALLFFGAAGAADAQQDPEVKHVKANGITIAYTERGQGQPLVLIHGGGLTSRMWGGMLEGLSASYRVITPDTRGHGGTDNPDHAFSYTLLADDVEAFCKALKLEKPVIMGYSDGGIVALTVGILKPDLPKALVLGGAVVPGTPEDVARYMEGMDAFYPPVGAKVAPLADADLDAMYNADKESWDFMARLHAKPGAPDYWRTLMKDVWAAWMNPQAYAYTPEQLAAVRVPTLVLVGDRDDFFLVEGAVRLYRQLAQGELAVAPHAGHDFFRARPELFLTPTLDFLGRVTK